MANSPAVLLSCPNKSLFISALHCRTGRGLQCLSSNAHLLNLLCDIMHALFSACFIHIRIIYQLMLILTNKCTDSHSELHPPGMRGRHLLNEKARECLNCSVHERFCMAAAKADQVADTATIRQQATSLQPAAEDSRSSTVIFHTPAPEQPRQAASQGQTEAASEKDESGPQGRGSTEQSSTSEQAEQSANSAAGESPDAAGEEEGAPCRQDAAGAEARQNQIRQEETAGTEQAPGTQTVSKSDMPASASDLGRVKPLRPPLAAVQEGSAPMLGSLSFKPTSMQRVHDEGTTSYSSGLLP